MANGPASRRQKNE